MLVEPDFSVPMPVRCADPGFVRSSRKGSPPPSWISCRFGSVQELRDERRSGLWHAVVRALFVGDRCPGHVDPAEVGRKGGAVRHAGSSRQGFESRAFEGLSKSLTLSLSRKLDREESADSR